MAIPSHFHTQLSSEVGIRGPAKPEMLISWSFTEILSTPFVTVNLIILLFYSMPNNGPLLSQNKGETHLWKKWPALTRTSHPTGLGDRSEITPACRRPSCKNHPVATSTMQKLPSQPFSRHIIWECQGYSALYHQFLKLIHLVNLKSIPKKKTNKKPNINNEPQRTLRFSG